MVFEQILLEQILLVHLRERNRKALLFAICTLWAHTHIPMWIIVSFTAIIKTPCTHLTTSVQAKIKQSRNRNENKATTMKRKNIIKCIYSAGVAGHIRFNRNHNLTRFHWQMIQSFSHQLPSHNRAIHLTGNMSRILVHRPHKLVLISSQGCCCGWYRTMSTQYWCIQNERQHSKIAFASKCETTVWIQTTMIK